MSDNNTSEQCRKRARSDEDGNHHSQCKSAPPPPNELCYWELISQEPSKTSAFYEQVFGWQPRTTIENGQEFTFFERAPHLGSHIRKRDECETQSVVTYVNVVDLDATIVKAQEAGAVVIVPKMPVAEKGWFAYLMVPGGIIQGVWQESNATASTTATATTTTEDTPASPTESRVRSVGILSVLVSDQDQALSFYRDKLGFVVTKDAPCGPIRWITIRAPHQNDGFELTLLKPESEQDYPLIGRQAGSAPLFTLNTADCNRDYERLRALGVEFTQTPTEQFYGTEALFKDCCGNIINLISVKPH